MKDKVSILDGWHAYLIQPPPRDALVRFWSESTGQQWTSKAADIHPETNAVGLYWKLTGLELMRTA